MVKKNFLTFGSLVVLLPLLAACGGGTTAGTPPATPSTTAPPPTPPPPPPPAPPPVSYNTAEYQRSNAAVKINALAAYDAGATGAGITAAVVDSGVNPALSEFSGRISPASQDVAGNRGLGDEDGHGTSVSAILLAAKNDAQIQGVAFAANLLALRTDTPGSCQTTGEDGGCSHADENIARAIDIAVANHARVINISLGGDAPNSDLQAAIGRATAAGTIIVIAAGNDGTTNPDSFALIANSPAAKGLVLIAGGVDANNVISTYSTGGSNKAGVGASHYLMALSSLVRSINQAGEGILGSGTSYAAPAISGAVALLAQAFPNLTGAQIVELLLSSARDLGDAGVDAVYGHGLLDLSAAFAARGSTSVAGTQVILSPTDNSTLSAPMGDAPQQGLSTLVLDSLGRAYRAELNGSFRRGWTQGRLLQGLSPAGPTAGMGFGATGMVLSITESSHGPTIGPLAFTAQDRAAARALAGFVVTRLSRQTRIAFGVNQRSTALVDQIGLQRAASFLLAEAAGDSLGFATMPGYAFAIRHQGAGWGLSLSTERGDALVWDGLRRQAYDRFAYNRVSLTADRQWGALRLQIGGAQLREKATVLGARFSPALGAPGAVTNLLTLEGMLDLGEDWELNGRFQRGWTRVAAGGLRPSTDHLGTTAWSFDLLRNDLWHSGNRFAVRISQPVRVTSGGFALNLAHAWDYAQQRASFEQGWLNLAPKGREVDVEAVYQLPLWAGRASIGAFIRRDPGHDSRLPLDKGGAARVHIPF